MKLEQSMVLDLGVSGLLDDKMLLLLMAAIGHEVSRCSGWCFLTMVRLSWPGGAMSWV